MCIYIYVSALPIFNLLVVCLVVGIVCCKGAWLRQPLPIQPPRLRSREEKKTVRLRQPPPPVHPPRPAMERSRDDCFKLRRQGSDH